MGRVINSKPITTMLEKSIVLKWFQAVEQEKCSYNFRGNSYEEHWQTLFVDSLSEEEIDFPVARLMIFGDPNDIGYIQVAESILGKKYEWKNFLEKEKEWYSQGLYMSKDVRGAIPGGITTLLDLYKNNLGHVNMDGLVLEGKTLDALGYNSLGQLCLSVDFSEGTYIDIRCVFKGIKPDDIRIGRSVKFVGNMRHTMYDAYFEVTEIQ